ncbi:MAG TPA: hypothetical protein VER55_04715, partial [Ardenticatenaceae bacterium]|nr:hypothetical protein [Ardenticatenaceae bacterium]
MALSSTKTTGRKILGVHPWLDSHPGWRARTTSILTYDPRFYERPLVRQVWLIARLARDFDACALFYEARFILPAAFLIRLLSRSRIVSGEVYPKIVSMNKRALLSHFPLFLAYRSLFALADRAIVHSRFEISLYSAFFRVPA